MAAAPGGTDVGHAHPRRMFRGAVPAWSSQHCGPSGRAPAAPGFHGTGGSPGCPFETQLPGESSPWPSAPGRRCLLPCALSPLCSAPSRWSFLASRAKAGPRTALLAPVSPTGVGGGQGVAAPQQSLCGAVLGQCPRRLTCALEGQLEGLKGTSVSDCNGMNYALPPPVPLSQS